MPIQPESSTAMVDGATPLDFDIVVERLADARSFVLSTSKPDGRPHAVPILAVWVDAALHFAAADDTQKAHNLAVMPACVITTSAGGSDLVIEGTAQEVVDEDAVAHVAHAYRTVYGWDPQPRDSRLWAQGAPTAGPPPFAVYRVDPDKAFAFPTDDSHTPTRWQFPGTKRRPGRRP